MDSEHRRPYMSMWTDKRFLTCSYGQQTRTSRRTTRSTSMCESDILKVQGPMIRVSRDSATRQVPCPMPHYPEVPLALRHRVIQAPQSADDFASACDENHNQVLARGRRMALEYRQACEPHRR